MNFLCETLNNSLYPGQRFPLPGSVTATVIAQGVLEFTRATVNSAAPWVMLSTGIHGNETAPIEMVNGLVMELFSGQLTLGCQLEVQIGNIEAIRAEKRYLSYDMNRLFNGTHQQFPDEYEAQRAAQLENITRQFFQSAPSSSLRYHYDMHTALRESVYEQFAIRPYQAKQAQPIPLMHWLYQAGVTTFLFASHPSSTYSDFSSRTLGVDAYTIELGKANAFGHNNLASLRQIDRILRKQISEPSDVPPAPKPSDLTIFRVKYDLIKNTETFVLRLDRNTKNFTLLRDGFIIAQDQQNCYVARGGEERIVFPNPDVALGLRAGIIVEPISGYEAC